MKWCMMLPAHSRRVVSVSAQVGRYSFGLHAVDSCYGCSLMAVFHLVSPPAAKSLANFSGWNVFGCSRVGVCVCVCVTHPRAEPLWRKDGGLTHCGRLLKNPQAGGMWRPRPSFVTNLFEMMALNCRAKADVKSGGKLCDCVALASSVDLLFLYANW